ncbi:helix-turn-helix domain-containing protein [bacterium]|nr:helix-turn-helix domain-containing protein [bacterium]MDY4502630.1 helix-turn-helix transcriptional regulator [Bariatricus sp.]
MELNKNCGKRLKECIKDKGMTQKDLSVKSHFTIQYISNIVTGKKPMTITAAKIFSECLGVSESYLLCECDYKTNEEAERAQMESDTRASGYCMTYLDSIGIHIRFFDAFPKNGILKSDQAKNILCTSKEEFFQQYEESTNSYDKHVSENTFVEIRSNNYDVVLCPITLFNLLPTIEFFTNAIVENFLDNLQCNYHNLHVNLSNPDHEVKIANEKFHQP